MALTPAPPEDIEGEDDRQQKGAATQDTANYDGPRFPLVVIGHIVGVGGVRRKHLHISRGSAAKPIVDKVLVSSTRTRD